MNSIPKRDGENTLLNLQRFKNVKSVLADLTGLSKQEVVAGIQEMG